MRLPEIRFRHRRGLVAMVTLGLLGIGTAGWLAMPAAAPDWRTVAVRRGEIEEVVLASGVLAPIRQVNVGAQVNGQLSSLKVALGERVRQGQLLAEIDPQLPGYELRRAEAALHHAQAQREAKAALLRQHRLTLMRETRLREQGANSPADLEAAQSQAEASQADVAAAEAQLKQARVAVETARANLAYTRIVAPMDGQVIAIVTQEGQTVVSAQTAPTILVLGDVDRMQVKAKISEADVVRVHAGQEAWFSILGAPQRKFQVSLQSVEPSPPLARQDAAPEPGSAGGISGGIYYNGLLEVVNTDGMLKPAMTAQVSIVLGRARDTLLVPVGALVGPDRAGRYTVRVRPAGKHARLEARQVEVGLNDHVSAQILSGLAEGELVVEAPGADEAGKAAP